MHMRLLNTKLETRRRGVSIGELALLALGLGALSACSTISSVREGPTRDDPNKITTSPGLPYYLPRRPILISVVVDKDGAPSVTVSPGTMEPDLRSRFTLQYHENLVGTNAVVLTMNSKGL